MTATKLTQPDDVFVLSPETSAFSIGTDLLINFCVVGFAFLLVHLVVSHASLLGAAPVFSDDFDGFGSTLSNIRTSWFRPLSTVMWSFLCALGPRKFFLIAEIWVIAYIALVFTYTKALFAIKSKVIGLTVIAAITAVCFEYLTQYFYFSGAILGVMSGSFAVASMLSFLSLRDEKFKAYWLLAPILLSIASLLCKEDFALPMLLFFGFQIGTSRGGDKKKAIIVLLSTGLVLGATFVLQKVIAPSQFFSGQSVHYEMGLGVSSILHTYKRYLFCTKGAVIACLVQAIGSLYVLARNHASYKRELLLLTLQSMSLIGPFSLLPNHFCEFYALAWICFQSAFILLLAIPTAKAVSAPKWLTVVLTVLVSVVVVWCTQPQRAGLLGWYSHASSLSSNEDASLLKYKTKINQAKSVVVVDPPACNAWLRTDGSYLRNRLGLQTQWLVLAERDSELGKQVKQFADLHYPGIDWQIYDKIVPMQAPDAVVLKFDPDGHASLAQGKF
ncbi:MAG: hypothetical protein P4L53_27290 [Candidatus Obscuribacterales bacterium]|nr:hypothetical protein [Candidatus Obscuribacterales bacterium]